MLVCSLPLSPAALLPHASAGCLSAQVIVCGAPAAPAAFAAVEVISWQSSWLLGCQHHRLSSAACCVLGARHRHCFAAVLCMPYGKWAQSRGKSCTDAQYLTWQDVSAI